MIHQRDAANPVQEGGEIFQARLACRGIGSHCFRMCVPARQAGIASCLGRNTLSGLGVLSFSVIPPRGGLAGVFKASDVQKISRMQGSEMRICGGRMVRHPLV